MNLDALPYTSYIVLLEFCVGSLLFCVYADWRGQVASSFVKFCAAMAATGAVVMLLNVQALDPKSAIGGFRLNDDVLTLVKAGSVVFVISTLPYMLAVFRGDRHWSLITGIGATAIGFALVGVFAYYISLPAWGFAGVLLSLVAGTLAVGGVVMSMTLGHWYLMTPRLPKEPLQELTLILIATIGLQTVLMLVNIAIPPRETPDATAFLGSADLFTNPAFWLRIAIGLGFAALLSYMAYLSSKGHPKNDMAMMSATGLLYIAVGAVLVGEVLARGLLFLTGVPV